MRQRKQSKQQAPNSKTQIPSKKSNPNSQMEGGAKPRDLEDRTFRFAESVRSFVKQLPRTISNTEDVRQLVRASGSVAANWIEARQLTLISRRLSQRTRDLLFLEFGG